MKMFKTHIDCMDCYADDVRFLFEITFKKEFDIISTMIEIEKKEYQQKLIEFMGSIGDERYPILYDFENGKYVPVFDKSDIVSPMFLFVMTKKQLQKFLEWDEVVFVMYKGVYNK